MKVLVTGATGFFGRHFVEVAAQAVTERIDLGDAAGAREALGRIKPDCIVHFAGTFGGVPDHELYRINTLGLGALLDGVREHVPRANVIAIGSAAEYGRPARLPVDETHPCAPVSAYGQSKWLATELALFHHRAYGTAVTVVRPFQLLGKGISTRLAPGAFAQQIVSSTRVVRVGNLDSERDFVDVKDAARAVWSLCEKPAPGEIFNVCTGRPVKMADLLGEMIRASGRDLQVERDASRVRGATDVPTIAGSHQKLTQHTGWKPEVPFEESVAATLATFA
jgi:GDP-4-dehydro-6-deoxy-D-mannose reductase